MSACIHGVFACVCMPHCRLSTPRKHHPQDRFGPDLKPSPPHNLPADHPANSAVAGVATQRRMVHAGVYVFELAIIAMSASQSLHSRCLRLLSRGVSVYVCVYV